MLEKVLKEIYPEAMTANYLILTDELQWSENDFVAKAYALGYKAAKDAFTNSPAPKAIACFTDTFALGVVAYCHEHNIVIGKDIFISGFNNIEAVKYNPYPIASATHPIDESMEILLEQMDKKDPFKQTIPLKVNLRSI